MNQDYITWTSSRAELCDISPSHLPVLSATHLFELAIYSDTGSVALIALTTGDDAEPGQSCFRLRSIVSERRVLFFTRPFASVTRFPLPTPTDCRESCISWVCGGEFDPICLVQVSSCDPELEWSLDSDGVNGRREPKPGPAAHPSPLISPRCLPHISGLPHGRNIPAHLPSSWPTHRCRAPCTGCRAIPTAPLPGRQLYWLVNSGFRSQRALLHCGVVNNAVPLP